MIIKVICPKCAKLFDWQWEKQESPCPHCKADLNIREVKLAPGELPKLFEAKK